ncbi:PQQ-binding-like beta-propeller repeat protein [Aerococcaceae bacterium NML191219]|nr:PQQ-binding-like beta-propeller repeat protein [Aerococcaceae bacterium NML191219]
MFREKLVKNCGSSNLIFSDLQWALPVEGLVRTPFFDPENTQDGYVVFYSEVNQEYGILKFNILTGEILWKQSVVNGGYGTPLVYKNLVIVLKEFDSIAAFSTEDGSFVWEYKGDGRVRSSLNIIDDKIVFSSSNIIHFVTEEGKLDRKIEKENSFFFGTISMFRGYLLTLYTINDEVTQTSHVVLGAINLDGAILFEVDLGESYIISADTSGFFLIGESIYVNSGETVFKISPNSGHIIWKNIISGISGRHVPVVDGKSVYVTTLSGNIYCINSELGEIEWKIETEEGSIVAPPSIFENTLLVLADCSMYFINKLTGRIYDRNIIGHSPYSAITIQNNFIIVGGGEPPAHGLLLCYASSLNFINESVVSHFEIGNCIENTEMQVLAKLDVNVESIELLPSVISQEKIIKGDRVEKSNIFTFLIPLKKNNISGMYCIPVNLLFSSGRKKMETILIRLISKKPLPGSFKLKHLYKNIQQTDYYNSGAAIAEFLFGMYGKKISQDEFRKIIDYIKMKSNWKDQDFQTWRLILKRALSSPATTLEEFIENEEGMK